MNKFFQSEIMQSLLSEWQEVGGELGVCVLNLLLKVSTLSSLVAMSLAKVMDMDSRRYIRRYG